MKFKRSLSFLLAAIMSLSTLAWLSLLPAAEEDASVTPVNYAENLIWDKQVGTPTVTTADKGAVMSGLSNSWDSVGCDILPALKAAIEAAVAATCDNAIATGSIRIEPNAICDADKQNVT